MISDLILPESARISKQQRFIKDRIYDLLYKLICQKKSNEEIQKVLRKKHMPPMDASEINNMRQWFKEKEDKYPKSMAQKRKVLGLG